MRYSLAVIPFFITFAQISCRCAIRHTSTLKINPHRNVYKRHGILHSDTQN